MAVNFVQHNRCESIKSIYFTLDVYLCYINSSCFHTVNLEESGPPKRRKYDNVPDKRKQGTSSAATTSKDGDEKAGGKATDDYHYERFKKQFRRY